MASGRIKGITVEIGGDVTGLDKALKTVNSTIKNTQSQLKDVERLLKLDPSNTELLEQKQRLLKDAIGATKEKLDALKTAQEQAKQQMESGELGRDKYDALQREIIETEQELDKLTSKAGESSAALVKIGEAGKTIDQVGQKISGVGQGLTKNVTAPIMAIGAASMVAFSEVDSAMDTVIAKTGASGDEMERLQKIVEGLATSIPTDFQTAGNAVGEVATRFDDVGDNLEILSGQFIKFAQLNNVDVVTAIDNVQASMAAFGVPTSQAGLVLDTLNTIAQQTGVDVNQLSGIMTTNAGVMKEMGFSYSESANFLANLNKNGVDASGVMTGLKKAWQNSVSEGKNFSDALSEMNGRIKNATTDQEAYTLATELFGAKAGPAIAQAVRDGRLSLDDLGKSMSDYAGNLETTFTATQDPIDQNTLLMNQLKLLGSDLATTIQEVLVPVFETLRAKLSELREWWSGLSEEQQQNIVKIAGVVAAVGPLLVVLGNVTSAVGKGITSFSSMGKGLVNLITKTKAGQGPLIALKTAIGGLSAPVVAVVAVIGVLVAAFVTLWKNNEEFRNKVTSIWNEVKKSFTTFANDIKSKLNAVGINFKSVTETIKKIWNGFCNLLAPVFTTAFELIKTGIQTAFNAITSILDIFIGIFTGNWEQAWSGVKNYFSNIWNAIKSVFSTILDGIKGVVNTFLGWFKTDWNTVWTSTKEKFVNIWDNIKNKAKSAVDGIKNVFKTGFESAKNTISNIFDGLKNKISNTMDSVKEKVRSVIEKVKGFFNFQFQWPHVPLPHFSISPPGWKIGDLLKGSIPSLGIEWYRKAMKGGMILDSPTIFGMQGNRLLAGGEAGSETVVGTKSLMQMIADAVQKSQTNQVTYGAVNVYVTSYGTDAAAIAEEIGQAIAARRRLSGSW